MKVQWDTFKVTLALIACGASTAAAAPPQQPAYPAMKGEPVIAATPEAAKASPLSTSKSLATRRVVNLAAPASSEVEKARTRDLNQSQSFTKDFKIGFGRKVASSHIDLGALRWQTLADGSQVTRVEIASGDAAALRARLMLAPTGKSNGDPDRVTLRFAGDDGRVFDETGRRFSGDGGAWSPIVSGGVMTVEITVPKGARPIDYSLDVPTLSHLTSNPAEKNFDDIGASGDCEQDIVCRTKPTPGFLAAASAVAHIATTTETGESGWCTGTLLNNSNTPKRSLFWTAAHCLTGADGKPSQAVADSFVTYWFFQATDCGNKEPSPKTVIQVKGTKLLFGDAKRDTALLELRDAPPSGAWYAGWNTEPIDTLATALEGIHHPRGDLKKFSLGKSSNLTTTFESHFPVLKVRWGNKGVTEGGSSGSGIFTVDQSGNYELRGGLYGGPSYCSAEGEDRSDYYSIFSAVWPKISQYFSPQP